VGGNLDNCFSRECKFFSPVDGACLHFGPFDNIGGLLFTCRDMYGPAWFTLLYQRQGLQDKPLCV
jgi:hypothetical protein